MKIIDCFTFYNELDMLELRLMEMYDSIDYFVLVEATKTYIGKEKVLYYDLNKDRYSVYNDKIIHIIVDDMPYDNNAWLLEKHQRRCIDRGVSKLDLKDDDVIIITDLDEIIDTNIINNIRNKDYNIDNSVLYSLEQDLYYYNLNTKHINKWYHPKLLNYYTYTNIYNRDPENIRMNNYYKIIVNGGWHLSYFGDIEFIKNKIKNFSHQEYNNDKYINDDKLINNIKNCQSIFDLDNNIKTFQYIKTEDNRYLPKKYMNFSKFYS